MTLEQLGYEKENFVYVKYIGQYKISLFEAEGGYVRRILKNNSLVDIRNLKKDEIETDYIFMEVLKQRALAIDFDKMEYKKIVENHFKEEQMKEVNLAFLYMPEVEMEPLEGKEIEKERLLEVFL